MKILLVDDDAGVRITLKIALAKRGFDVSIAAAGFEAIELLGRDDFDWLITDCQMKPMDGFQLAARARRLCPFIKIVMITGICLEPCLNADILKVFTKPVDDGALAAYLRQPQVA
ncbi:MAG: hypothetical protein A3J74_02245 [Elusimicrobia bacterium RIFCSPHIGHO2_02_FULL_57_9]|nr:MAG: hypothetical protein A3J74_02245 [Elusimicrobia bacterium RIFCSPHIGHO2_02_FULL_57_9]